MTLRVNSRSPLSPKDTTSFLSLSDLKVFEEQCGQFELCTTPDLTLSTVEDLERTGCKLLILSVEGATMRGPAIEDTIILGEDYRGLRNRPS